MDCLVVGCGLTGSVIARQLAERGKKVFIWERRNHAGGNMYDYVDKHGFLVQKYGPHTFHTKEKSLYDYICRFEEWQKYKLICGAMWDGKYTPTPFNFTTVDTFFPAEQARRLKRKLEVAFDGRKTATVVEALTHPDPDVRAYAEYLFKNDYAPYTAKQWGISAEEIDSSVLKRVPLRFSYKNGYFDDAYQVMPVHSYSYFFDKLLSHPNIEIKLNTNALEHLRIHEGNLLLDGQPVFFPVVYTGALDELFGCVYGKLPYRSLRFEWKYAKQKNLQPVPVIAYPQEKECTRIIEYKKLPHQQGVGTSYAIEYAQSYQGGNNNPYYPMLTKESLALRQQYKCLAETIQNLFCCGRLGDFEYYNMDQALKRALSICEEIK